MRTIAIQVFVFGDKRMCKASGKTSKGTSTKSKPVKKRRSALDYVQET